MLCAIVYCEGGKLMLSSDSALRNLCVRGGWNVGRHNDVNMKFTLALEHLDLVVDLLYLYG